MTLLLLEKSFWAKVVQEKGAKSMRYLLIASILLNATSVNAAPAKKRQAHAAEPAACKSLGDDYENASKKLAMLKADGLLDNSAPRATMRETESNNILSQARITMDLMRNNGCKGPTAAPSADFYLLDALKCSTAISKQSTEATLAIMRGGTVSDLPSPPECDQTKWVSTHSH
jgi:hypothetical protein